VDARRIVLEHDGGADERGRDGRPAASAADEFRRAVESGRGALEASLREEYDARLAQERLRSEALLAGIRDNLANVLAAWEQDVLRLAMTIAGAILKREIAVDRDAVLVHVREALRHLVGVEKVKLRVNPRDEELLRQHRAEIFTATDSLRDMVIEADDKIEPGGCIAESESGNVDARVATQINRLEILLFEQNQQEPRS
jgi:flagellar biosynthesis/type III secretory pathway protein FliH